jgi:hypothetical protein
VEYLNWDNLRPNTTGLILASQLLVITSLLDNIIYYTSAISTIYISKHLAFICNHKGSRDR